MKSSNSSVKEILINPILDWKKVSYWSVLLSQQTLPLIISLKRKDNFKLTFARTLQNGLPNNWLKQYIKLAGRRQLIFKVIFNK